MTYGADRLHEEVSYLAFHLHWPLNDLLDLEHADRQRYLRLIKDLAARAGAAGPATSGMRTGV